MIRYYITNGYLLCERILRPDIYYIYILTLLAKDIEGVAEKHIRIRVLFITMNNRLEIYNTETIRVDRYYKGLLDEDISRLRFWDKEVKGTIMFERDDGAPNPNTYFKQNFYGALTEDDIFELTMLNT